MDTFSNSMLDVDDDESQGDDDEHHVRQQIVRNQRIPDLSQFLVEYNLSQYIPRLQNIGLNKNNSVKDLQKFSDDQIRNFCQHDFGNNEARPDPQQIENFIYALRKFK